MGVTGKNLLQVFNFCRLFYTFPSTAFPSAFTTSINSKNGRMDGITAQTASELNSVTELSLGLLQQTQ